MFETGFPSHWSTIKKLIWLRMILSSGGGTGQYVTVTGSSPLALVNSLAHAIHSLTQYGKCEQNGTPTPDAPVDIMCNNGALKYSANMANVNAQTARVGYYISTQGAVLADSYNWFYQLFVPVKPNTSYTLSMSTPVYYVTISEYSTAEDSGFVIRKNGTTGGNTSLTITTGADTNFIRFGANLNRVTVSMEMVLAINWMLNIGDTAMDYQPYVEGGIYTDGTPEELTVSGVNLITSALTGYGTYVSPTQAAGARAYKWLQNLPNGTYQFSVEGDYELIVQWRDPADPADGVAQGYENLTGWITSGVVTLDKSTGGYGIAVRRTVGTSSITPANFDGELYCYRTADIQTVTGVSTLLGLGDAYRDALEFVSGLLTHKVGVYVFDGTETVSKTTNASAPLGYYFSVDYVGDAHIAGGANKRVPAFCTHFVDVTNNLASMADGAFTVGLQRNRFYMATSAVSTADEYKALLAAQYAAGTPVIILYPLATETTEQTTPHSLHTVSGTTIVEAQTNVDPVELSVEYYASQAPGFGLGNPNAYEPSGGGEETE